MAGPLSIEGCSGLLRSRPVRVALAFGYAIYPDEGGDRETLLEQARVARIRMV